MTDGENLAVGLVGPGRTRNGLGPFLARFLEQAGARVVAVAGRTAERTARAACDLAERLGHPVEASPGAVELAERDGLDALVIASPIEAHLEALQAAALARLPTLCEKPLVHPDQQAEVPPVLDAFLEAAAPLVENCQWPLALPALAALHPRLDPGAARQVEMGLSPAGAGRAMVLESLSHLLSVLQALLPIGPGTELRAARYSTRAADAEEVTLEIDLAAPEVRARLHLARHPAQPRPAWLAVDGARIDRHVVLPRYEWTFFAGEDTHSVGDPQARLVYSFVQLIRRADLERTRSESGSIRERARLFHAILGAWR